MKKISVRTLMVSAALVLGSTMLMSSAQAQSMDDTLLTIYEPPHTFFIDGPLRKMIADVQTARQFRICVSRAKPEVPLKIEWGYDNKGKDVKKNHIVTPGDCFDFEANKVWVEAGRDMNQDFIIYGKIHVVR